MCSLRNMVPPAWIRRLTQKRWSESSLVQKEGRGPDEVHFRYRWRRELAAVKPLPSELTTPPVTKMYFIGAASFLLHERAFAPALLRQPAYPRRGNHVS